MTIDFARADNGSIYLERGFWHAAAMVSSASNRVGRPFTFVCDAPRTILRRHGGLPRACAVASSKRVDHVSLARHEPSVIRLVIQDDAERAAHGIQRSKKGAN